ncbi:hypothetical protein BDBG_08941 [Blastomyces gilchristii SLH14081]|uniref:Uncharacterized protein n=1 Tax=Blastomyces gilchristii (strain SLH14081) TaxID=559298 RepID=A0A179V596_BLAGS|nr:uncharacterized protein BDBG_08941 [Blastomyces gilchristii SLH14081]OAT13812.1 hypothetical protein BDBG_08941 [Blastomyces gilchristii SLH14081]
MENVPATTTTTTTQPLTPPRPPHPPPSQSQPPHPAPASPKEPRHPPTSPRRTRASTSPGPRPVTTATTTPSGGSPSGHKRTISRSLFSRLSLGRGVNPGSGSGSLSSPESPSSSGIGTGTDTDAEEVYAQHGQDIDRGDRAIGGIAAAAKGVGIITGGNAMASALQQRQQQQQRKTRRRKGSLRKTALLGTGPLRSDGRRERERGVSSSLASSPLSSPSGVTKEGVVDTYAERKGKEQFIQDQDQMRIRYNASTTTTTSTISITPTTSSSSSGGKSNNNNSNSNSNGSGLGPGTDTRHTTTTTTSRRVLPFTISNPFSSSDSYFPPVSQTATNMPSTGLRSISHRVKSPLSLSGAEPAAIETPAAPPSTTTTASPSVSGVSGVSVSDDFPNATAAGANTTATTSPTAAAAAAAVAAAAAASSSALEEAWDYAETEWWGWIILLVTWLVFVVGMGSCLGVWSWAWDVGETPYAPPELEDDPTLPIVGYYPALIICTAVMAWVWVVVAWVGMKYFRHANISGEDT